MCIFQLEVWNQHLIWAKYTLFLRAVLWNVHCFHEILNNGFKTCVLIQIRFKLNFRFCGACCTEAQRWWGKSRGWYLMRSITCATKVCNTMHVTSCTRNTGKNNKPSAMGSHHHFSDKTNFVCKKCLIYIIQFVRIDTNASTSPWACHWMLQNFHTKCVLWKSKRDFCRKWRHLTCYMVIMLLKYAVLEAKWLLRQAATIVRDTSATKFNDTECVYDREP